MRVVTILLFALVTSSSFGQQIFKKKQSLLGSPFEITVVAKDSVQGNLFSDLAIAEVKRIENLISDWIPTTQISEIRIRRHWISTRRPSVIRISCSH